MTRGTIAFVDYDKKKDQYLLFVSEQFNGDMAPDMDNGEKLIGYFKNIYLNGNSHEAKRHKMEQIVGKMIDEFGYEREVSFKCIPLEKTLDGFVLIDLRTTWLNKKKKKTIDYERDVWSSWFDYSDYLYIVPLFDPKLKLIIVDVKDDGTYENCYPKKDCLDVFYFREYVGSVSPENCQYIEKSFYEDELDEDEEDDPTSEELLEELDDKSARAPALNTNVLLPSKRFVEILTQYKDGDRYCLVVRDSDNKHVLFKEMR